MKFQVTLNIEGTRDNLRRLIASHDMRVPDSSKHQEMADVVGLTLADIVGDAIERFEAEGALDIIVSKVSALYVPKETALDREVQKWDTPQ